MRILIFMALLCHSMATFGAVTPAFSCENLFSPKDTFTAFNEAESEFTSLWSSVSAPEYEQDIGPEFFKQALAEANKRYDVYRAAVENHLSRNGVDFQWREFKSYRLEKLNRKSQVLFIKPNKRSPLNRFAAKMWKEYNVRVVYDSLALRALIPFARAAYDPKTKILYLDKAAGENRYPDVDQFASTEHEAVHVQSHAYREGRTETEGNHGLHMKLRVRGQYMYAEELVAHSVQFSRMGKALQYQLDPEKIKEEYATLQANTKTSLQYANMALEVLDFITQHDWLGKNLFKIKTIDGLNWVGFEDKRAGVEFYIHLRDSERSLFRKDPKAWTQAAVHRLKTHAEFTSEYLTNYRSDHPEYLKRMEAYQEAQRALIESLK